MKVCLVSCSMVLTVLGGPSGIAEPVKIGDRAPSFSIDEVLQAPGVEDVDSALEGHAVILEFWATWCGPCIQQIPHLNELAQAFADQPVRFLSVTAEERRLIEPFLRREPIDGWVGLDFDKSLQHSYGIHGIPTTVLIDRQGYVRAVTNPSRLNPQHIEALLAGGPIELPDVRLLFADAVKAGQDPVEQVEDRPEPLYQILVRPAVKDDRSGVMTMMGRDGKMTIMGQGASSILALLHRMPQPRVEVVDPLPDGLYDVIVSVPGSLKFEVIRDAFSQAIGFQASQATKRREVFVLKPPRQLGTGINEAASAYGSTSSSRGSIRANRITIADFAQSLLEPRVGMPLVDETGLTAHYDITLHLSGRKPEELMADVESQLGIPFAREEREITVLEVRRIK